jgi:hypothetical protein
MDSDIDLCLLDIWTREQWYEYDEC